jgi:poly(3-hydroxybutyrate) depolymerase
MMLHGRGGSSHLAAHDFGWIEKSDKEGFMIVSVWPSPLDLLLAVG